MVRSYFGKCFETGSLNMNFFFDLMSSKGGISGSTSVSAIGCCFFVSYVDGVEGVADVVDGVEGVADVMDDVTFAASCAAFSTLVSFCPGSYHFPVSPSCNFLGVTWNCSEMVEVLSLLLNNSLLRTVWIIAARHQVGCLGGRTAEQCLFSNYEQFFLLTSGVWKGVCVFVYFGECCEMVHEFFVRVLCSTGVSFLVAHSSCL